MLGSLIQYLKGMRRMIFQLSGFYCKAPSSSPPAVGFDSTSGMSLEVSIWVVANIRVPFWVP